MAQLCPPCANSPHNVPLFGCWASEGDFECECEYCWDPEVAQMIADWEAEGMPLADGTHAHRGIDLEDCEAKRAAERAAWTACDRCGADDAGPFNECPDCGLIFLCARCADFHQAELSAEG